MTTQYIGFVLGVIITLGAFILITDGIAGLIHKQTRKLKEVRSGEVSRMMVLCYVEMFIMFFAVAGLSLQNRPEYVDVWRGFFAAMIMQPIVWVISYLFVKLGSLRLPWEKKPEAAPELPE